MPLFGMISIDLANDPDMVGHRDDYFWACHVIQGFLGSICIYQLFWCLPGYQSFDQNPIVGIYWEYCGKPTQMIFR